MCLFPLLILKITSFVNGWSRKDNYMLHACTSHFKDLPLFNLKGDP